MKALAVFKEALNFFRAMPRRKSQIHLTNLLQEKTIITDKGRQEKRVEPPYVRRLSNLVAHDCGYPLSRYTCRATRVATDFLDFIAFCRCSSGVAPHPLKILVSHLPPPPVPGGVAPKFGSEKVSRYTGVSQLQLRVSRYTVQLS